MGRRHPRGTRHLAQAGVLLRGQIALAPVESGHGQHTSVAPVKAARPARGEQQDQQAGPQQGQHGETPERETVRAVQRKQRHQGQDRQQETPGQRPAPVSHARRQRQRQDAAIGRHQKNRHKRVVIAVQQCRGPTGDGQQQERRHGEDADLTLEQ